MPNPIDGNNNLQIASLSSATNLTIHIPKPVPISSPVERFLFVVYYGSKMRSGSTMSCDNPGPVSLYSQIKFLSVV